MRQSFRRSRSYPTFLKVVDLLTCLLVPTIGPYPEAGV
jgi:hypothetical protein